VGVDPKGGVGHPSEANRASDDGQRHAQTEHGLSVGAAALAEGRRRARVAAVASAIQPEELRFWQRVGRGRSFEFEASDEEIGRWLAEGVPAEDSPYLIVGADRVKVGRRYSWEPFTYHLSDLKRCFDERADGSPNLFIWSLVLTPDLSLHPGTNVDATCSVNGLVLVQRQIGRTSPRIAVTQRVQHVETGEVRQHEEYARVFDRLRAFIRKRKRERNE
jgi:hypothetical protein